MGYWRNDDRRNLRRLTIAIHRNVIGAGDHGQTFGPEGGVDFCAAGEDGEGVGLSAIQTQAFNLHLTAVDAVTIEIALIQHRCAGSERGLMRTDKSATITGDAGWVGGDDLGATTGDFDPAVQVTGVAAIDFVQDDACAASRQPGIALNPTAELALCVSTTVVENSAVSTDIELAVAVARDTSGTGSLNVHQRYTVAGLQNGGALIGWGGCVRADLGTGGCACQRKQNDEEQPKTQAHRNDSRFNANQQDCNRPELVELFADDCKIEVKRMQ